MAINYELLNKGGISLGTNFELLSEKPLDSRLVVPSLDGLQNYIDNAAAYEGMIVYDKTTKKTYQVQIIDGVLSYREFGINEAELKDLIASETTAAMEFKGAVTSLPEDPNKGDFYKAAGNFEVDGETIKVGDSIVYDGEQWFIIPSGDDIEDTWRPVTGVDNDATLTFADGDKTEAVVAADGTIKYNHVKIDAPEDKTAEGDEKTRTYLTAVETDGFGHITGYKTATENVEDTNTTYTFEGQADESSVYFQVTSSEENADPEVVYLDTYSKNEANITFKAKREKKLDAVETEANVFVDTIEQDVDGNITITTKAVDFSAITDRLDDLEAIDHSHSFNEEELNLIADGDVSRWNTAAENAATALQEVTGENAIVVDNKSKVTLKLDTTDTGNVVLTQSTNGLKANIDLSGYELTDTTYKFENGEEEGTLIVTEEGKNPQVVEIGGQKVSKAKEELIGKDTDADTADTIYGAKKYADKAIENANLDQYAKTADLGELASVDTITAEKVTDFATEVAKVKVNEAVKATQDGDGKVITDTYAAKATTIEGYGITDAYTKTEIEALFTWGSF